MKLEDLWIFVTSDIPNFVARLFSITELSATRSLAIQSLVIVLFSFFAVFFTSRSSLRSLKTGSAKGAQAYGSGPSIGHLAVLLGVFFIFLIALLSALWAFTHFITCKQPQCTIIFLAAVVILFAIFLALAVPFSNTLAQLEITITNKAKIGARGLSLSLVVVGFSGLLAVGYLIPC
jgi:uncharacterized membrane protein